MGCGDSQHRQLINHGYDLFATKGIAAQIAVANLHIGHRFAALFTLIMQFDLRAHLDERIHNARARGVDAHTGNRNAALWHDGGSGEQQGGG